MARKAGAISGLRRSRRLAGLSPLKTHTDNRRTVTKRRRRGVVVGQGVSSQYPSSERSPTSERGGSDDSGVELLDRSSADRGHDCESRETCTGQRALSASYEETGCTSREPCTAHGSHSEGDRVLYEDRITLSARTCSSASESNASGARPHSRGASVEPRGNDESQPSCSSDVEQQIRPDEVAEEGPSSPSSASHTLPSSSTPRQNARERDTAGHHRQPAFGIMQTFSEHISGIPVQGESFCSCSKDSRSKDLQCSCGEEDQNFEWTWDRECKSPAAEVSANGREARFHVNYSSGTAAARGSEPMTDGQYFWEIKMISPVYGTDMMVGVGTANVDLDAFQYSFCSLLGRDGESWGLSYYGKAHHKGQFSNFRNARFGQGSILGLHLDMWQGTLSYYKNRQPLGVIFSGLRGKTLYPMISSTAARTGMKLVKACSYATSLEFLCCQVLRKMVPLHLDVTTALSLPPGLNDFFLVNNLLWVLRSNKLSIPNMEASSNKRPHSSDEETDELEVSRGETGVRNKRVRRS